VRRRELVREAEVLEVMKLVPYYYGNHRLGWAGHVEGMRKRGKLREVKSEKQFKRQHKDGFCPGTNRQIGRQECT
jgi:hypothetical protein